MAPDQSQSPSSHSASSVSSTPPSTSATAPLQATIAVEPRSAVGSALLSETRDAVSVSQNRSPDGTCRSTATVCTDETCEPLYVEQQTPNTCVCSVLDAFDCVYSIDAVEHGNLVVTVTLEDRHQLSASSSDSQTAGHRLRFATSRRSVTTAQQQQPNSRRLRSQPSNGRLSNSPSNWTTTSSPEE